MEAVHRGWAREALPGFFSPLEVAASVPTTMARAAELAAAGEPEGATVVAEEQTEGRGRLGRVWVAPPGSSLLLSVVLRPPIAPEAVW
ncbi:MAG TPA: biotin--[acetyl-CoA-carboxylase] ligase, partial [Actinomycetes bacterium]|nr:biotin--[acetyl-CoA-carboxylase] ligase [Actinomycetes bacterium]